ncbi:MAG: hypothetical protein CME63_09595 [Halobacteriovoraceae bacterium]|nr:hypothetical protein [Halobacteriovoraceae bacterium]MBC97991.1 hypothetical protein [Halobacteriovoraceae bacterium]|tara:strand:+ start:201113 stop:201349 length:237 start_codon:yes stop_codon:yes gene_type:complete
MCDCCKAEGRNSQFICGDGPLKMAHLYKVYMGRTASVKLCRLCDIELFKTGESRFLQRNIKFAQYLYTSKAPSSSLFD